MGRLVVRRQVFQVDMSDHSSPPIADGGRSASSSRDLHVDLRLRTARQSNAATDRRRTAVATLSIWLVCSSRDPVRPVSLQQPCNMTKLSTDNKIQTCVFFLSLNIAKIINQGTRHDGLQPPCAPALDDVQNRRDSVCSKCSEMTSQYLISILNLAGLMALIAVAFYGAFKLTFHSIVQQITFGLILGGGAIFVSLQPIMHVSGVQNDPRNIFVGISAAIFGPLAGIVTFLLLQSPDIMKQHHRPTCAFFRFLSLDVQDSSGGIIRGIWCASVKCTS